MPSRLNLSSRAGRKRTAWQARNRPAMPTPEPARRQGPRHRAGPHIPTVAQLLKTLF